MVFYTVSFSQVSIDDLVKKDKQIDPDKEYLIYEYRLPDWGYNQFYFNASNSFNGLSRSDKDISQENFSTSVQFSPHFIKYHESEQTVFSLNSSINSSFHHSSSKSDQINYSSRSNANQLRIDLNADATYIRYMKDRWFLYTQTDNRLYFLEWHENSTYINNNNNDTDRGISLQRNIDLSGRIGLGYNRVRNVTPMFRALRFNERMEDLNRTENPSYLSELAAFFAQRSGYSQAYDRPDKYFYNDLPDKIKSILNSSQPWEIIYLDETWDEIIGDRYEGWDITSGLLINYEKNKSNGPYLTELFLLGAYMEYRYYHNLSSFYQLGFDCYSSFTKSLNDNTSYEYLGKGQLQIENLFNLTDKMLAEINFTLESAFTSENIWQRRDRYLVHTILHYFLENNLSANFNASYNAYYNWPGNISFDYEDYSYRNSRYEEEKNWFITIGMTYFLDRGIF